MGSFAFRLTFDPVFRRQFYDAMAQRRLDESKAALERAKVIQEAERLEREAAVLRENRP